MATKYLKSSRAYEQYQLSSLHEEICQKKRNIRVLRNDFIFSLLHLKTEASLIDFAHVRSLFLGHNNDVLKRKGIIQQNKSNSIFLDKKFSMILRKSFLIILAIFHQKRKSTFNRFKL